MAWIHDIVVDCRHPASLARFWAAVVDGYEVAPYDADELARLRAAGINDPEDDPTVLVEAPGLRPRLWFQQVLEPKTVKNRVHLDLRCEDVETEVAHLVDLGAQVFACPGGRLGDLVVLTDPEGNEFCVFAGPEP
jgi:hypothetical protein